MIEDIFNTKPDYINEKGTKFWKDTFVDDYINHLKLKNIKAYYMQNGEYKTRVLINIKTKKYEYENQKLEDICVHLDILKKLDEYGKE